MGKIFGDMTISKVLQRPWNGYDYDKKSMAVVVAGHGSGCVLYTVGAHVRMELEEAGLSSLEELGLEPPEDGIWIWEGRGVWQRGSWEHPEDGEIHLEGTFRVPTEEEWKSISERTCPWNDSLWKLPAYRIAEAICAIVDAGCADASLPTSERTRGLWDEARALGVSADVDQLLQEVADAEMQEIVAKMKEQGHGSE